VIDSLSIVMSTKKRQREEDDRLPVEKRRREETAPFSCPLHELIEAPARDKFLSVLRNHLIPRIQRRKARDEKRAKRSLEYPVLEEIQEAIEAGKSAPLPWLSATTLMYLFPWMKMDPPFRAWMLGNSGDYDEWWDEAWKMIKCWESAKSVEWPGTALTGPQRVIDAWHCSEETMVVWLSDWFLLH
jgi:hypothetical protein